MTVAAAVIAGQLSPIVAGFAHVGEGIAGKVAEKVIDQAGHYVLEHLANRGLKLDSAALATVMRYDAAGKAVGLLRLDDFDPERDEQGRFAPAGGGATRPMGHPESADLRGWADPDPSLSIAERASRNAEGRTALAKTAEDHAKAFEAHAIAGRLHEVSGNTAKAEEHKAKAQEHKNEAQRMLEAIGDQAKPFFNPELEGWAEQDKKDGDFDESKHPRSANGQFGEGGEVSAGKLANTVLGKPGGFTVRPDGKKVTEGYVVSLPTSAGFNHVIDVKSLIQHGSKAAVHAAVKQGIKDWIAKAKPSVLANPLQHFGGWLQKDEKTKMPIAIHLDVSEVHPGLDSAIRAGRERNQNRGLGPEEQARDFYGRDRHVDVGSSAGRIERGRDAGSS